MLEARLAAISVQDGDGHLRNLEDALQEDRLDFQQQRRILIRAWEAAVEGALEDGLLSLDEENALAKYADHSDLDQHDLDGNGVQTSLVQAAVIRDVTRGVVPQRQRVNGNVPFNVMTTVSRRQWHGSARTQATATPETRPDKEQGPRAPGVPSAPRSGTAADSQGAWPTPNRWQAGHPGQNPLPQRRREPSGAPEMWRHQTERVVWTSVNSGTCALHSPGHPENQGMVASARLEAVPLPDLLPCS